MRRAPSVSVERWPHELAAAVENARSTLLPPEIGRKVGIEYADTRRDRVPSSYSFRTSLIGTHIAIIAVFRLLAGTSVSSSTEPAVSRGGQRQLQNFEYIPNMVYFHMLFRVQRSRDRTNGRSKQRTNDSGTPLSLVESNSIGLRYRPTIASRGFVSSRHRARADRRFGPTNSCGRSETGEPIDARPGFVRLFLARDERALHSP
ncbi:hypothetical protein SAMN04489841_2726 [Natrinema salaciae]|uniref:Uncharacterized protein n=1 Tax=Natrinema salaciae TaxID=1186196 RepID=A0A1H9JXS5_9EURY|nr:hypothetical protein SAMN04489841_2726 [Natrinema salaciae]